VNIPKKRDFLAIPCYRLLTLLGAFLFAAYLVKHAQIRHEKSLAF
jgi:hypothetical protein